jgi:AraC-like DNA-binding protein
MGEITAMSPFHLNRVVREITGLPPWRSTALRIQEAKRLLLTTDASVTDACFAVGFSSLGSFSSRFTSQVGATPSDFKRSRWSSTATSTSSSRMIEARPQPVAERGHLGEIVGEGIDDGLIFIGVYPSAVARGFPVCGEVLRRRGRSSSRTSPTALGRPRRLRACRRGRRSTG